MKTSAFAIRLGCALIAVAVSVYPLSAETVTLKEFKGKGFDYGYEEWKDLSSVHSVADDAIHIKASAKGGAGVVFTEAIDISQCAFLEISLKRSSDAEAALIFKLHDGNNKSASWTVETKDVSQTEFTKIRLDLKKPDGDGKDLPDFKQITQLQIQGNFNPSDRIDVDLESVVASDAPAAPAPDKPSK